MDWGDGDKVVDQGAPVAPSAVSWGQADAPVRKVGAAENAGRGFVAGGGDLINALDFVNQHLNPAAIASTLVGKALGQPATDPLPALAQNAQQFGALAPDETADGLGSRVAGGVGRVIPNVAGALATGGTGSLEAAVPAALSRVPVLGRVLGAIARGAPTAAAATTDTAANLPDNMSLADKAKTVATAGAENLAMAGLPGAIGTNPLVRTASGAAIGAGIPAASAAIHGQQQDAATNIVGALMGSLLAQHSGETPVGENPQARAQFDEWAARHQAEAPAPVAPPALPAPEGVAPAAPIEGHFTDVTNQRALPAAAPAPADVAKVLTDAAKGGNTAALPAPIADAIAKLPEEARAPILQQAAASVAGKGDVPAFGAGDKVVPTPDGSGSDPVASGGQPATDGSGQAPSPSAVAGDMFGAATPADRLRAATAAQDALRNGQVGGKVDTGDGGLFDGKRPEQLDVETAAKAAQARAAEASRTQALADIDKRIAEMDAANNPARGRNALPDEGVDDALTFLAKKGGLDRNAFISEGIDPKDAGLRENNMRGGASRPLFRASNKGGMSLDHAAETLWQHGYLPDQDNHAALDIIQRGVVQGDNHYSIYRQDQGDLMALEQQRRDIADHNTDFSDVPFSFAGERAQTADRGALAQAQQMEAMGRDSVPDREGNVPGSEADTHAATGWSRGKDGKWRFEIDDSLARINTDAISPDVHAARQNAAVDRALAARASGDTVTNRAAMDEARAHGAAMVRAVEPTVGDVLQHPALMSAYPELAKVRVNVKSNLGTLLGAYNPAKNVIDIRPPEDYPATGSKSLKSVMLHEIQHAIQDHEGFARGGSVDEFKEPLEQQRNALESRKAVIERLQAQAKAEGNTQKHGHLEVERRKVINDLIGGGIENDEGVHTAAVKKYRAVAGEVEARNTQARMDLSAADRRATPPSETEDVPRSQQIVKFGRDPSMDEGATHVTKQDRADAQRLSERLSEHVGKEVSIVPSNRVPDAVRRALAAFDDAFGGKTTVFHNETPGALDFQGVTLRDGKRFVNATSDTPLLAVAGHEMLHDMRADRPDLYKELADEMEKQGDLDKYLAQLRKNSAAGGLDPEAITRGEAHEELVADAVGDALTDPDFLDRLAKNNPSLFAKVAAYIKTALDRILSKLKNIGSNKYVRDVEAFRAKLEDVLTRYASERTGGPRASSGDDLAMSQRDYHGSHRPPTRENGAPLNDLTANGIYGDDVYGPRSAQYYGHHGGNHPMDVSTIRQYKSYRGEPDALVAIYRALPKDAPGEINAGDWVTINKDYAKDHAESQFGDDGKVIKKMVKASDIFTNGNSIHEFGYEPADTPAMSRREGATDPQTQTKAFRDWFGDSKVVDAKGEPLTVYHGTGADIESFDNSMAPTGNDKNRNGAMWFSDAPEVASDFAGHQVGETFSRGTPREFTTGHSNVVPAYLSIKNPYIDTNGTYAKHGGMSKADIAELKEEGYDGVIWPESSFDLPDTTDQGPVRGYYRNRKGEVFGNDVPYPSQYAVFDANQIKSATGNNGDFNPADNRIAFSRRPADDATRVQDDMPPRRPGESQADWMNRVYRKNGPELKQATQLAKMQGKLGRYAIRGMAAQNARAMDVADAALSGARKTFDKTPDVINYASVHQWETGKHIDDPDFRKFASVMQEGFDQRIAKIHAMAPDALRSLIENYMPHLYEDSSKAAKWYQGIMGKKPLEGDKSFLKQRTWPTLKEAMASGLRPISPNPVDWVMAKYAQMDKFIGMLDLKQDFAKRGWLMKLEAGQKPPEGFARVDDPAFQISGGLNGSYALPEMIAKDLNNYVGPGLSKYGLWRSFRAIQNGVVSANLGWSAFHAGFTSIDNAVTHGAVGLQRLAMGDIPGGLMALVKAVPTMLTSPFEGGKLNKQWTGRAETDPNTAAILDALQQGGARMKMGNAAAEYNNALPKVMRTIRRLQAPGALADRVDDAKRYARSHGKLETAGSAAMGLGKAAGNTLSALGEVSSFLIHHVLVPNQKMAARVTLLKFELDRAAGQLQKAGYDVKKGEYAKIIDLMHPDVLKQLASDVVDKVDFRLGQMTYDNFFYPKIAREISQALVMAPGWQAGAFQTMTGGVRDLARAVKPEKLVSTLDKEGKVDGAHRGRFTNNTANLIMLFLMVGGANAALQYMTSGQKPEDMKDLVAPRTGRKNADGSDERLMLPSYMKDHWEFVHHPIEMASHKLHPFWRTIAEMAENQDFYGTEIRHPSASAATQAKEVAGYLLKSLTPFSYTNTRKALDNNAGPGQIAANFVGVTNAPASITRTDFQTYVAKRAADAVPKGARTQEQKEASDRRHELESAIRAGEHPDMSDLTEKQQANVEKAARMEVPVIRFKRLSIRDKLTAYGMATPKERTQYDLRNLILSSHWQKSVMNLDESDRQEVLDGIQKLGSDSE